MYVGLGAQDLFLIVFIFLVILSFGCFPFLAHTGYLGDQSAVLFLGFNRYPRNGGIRDGNHFAILVGYDRGDEDSVLPDVHSEGLCNVATAQVDDIALFEIGRASCRERV